MSLNIEDYALIGDTHTGALVGNNGSIDWLCLPRFDSAAVFAALLGEADHGQWRLAPRAPGATVSRRYRGATLVLETDFITPGGEVRVTDFMPHRHVRCDLVRMVTGIRGRVDMQMRLVARFDYGSVVPWVRRQGGDLTLVAGPDALVLRTRVPVRGEDLATVADFQVGAGETASFVLSWHPSHEPPPPPVDAERLLRETVSRWEEWASRCSVGGPFREAAVRSLITLKALTFEPTGGIVAAPTTSLPERIGGVRNWDYRYCWVRDAALTLHSLMAAGYAREARDWREWLLRAVAGDPSKLQTVYGPAGERRLPEWEVPWLPGYAGSAPVRVGNAAAHQFQLDIYGEVMDALHQARCVGIPPERPAWALQVALMDFLESAWAQPDQGIWEVRGPRRHHTYSKVMAWVALDRAVQAVEGLGLAGPVQRWRHLRSEIHEDVCRHGVDPERGTFTQSYGSSALDASLLLIPQVGFLPPTDPRVVRTIDAIQTDLCRDGLVLRYETDGAEDGLPPGEGAFLAASFWLVSALALAGRVGEARTLFARLLAVGNDVGLLAEEYDPLSGHQLGNFPQAFSHIGLVNSALTLAGAGMSPQLGVDPGAPAAG